MKRTVRLTKEEIAVLDRQDPQTKGQGGFQDLLIGLQGRLNRQTGELHLSAADMEKIKRYAFNYRNGGWQDRLTQIFGRELGLGLDGNL